MLGQKKGEIDLHLHSNNSDGVNSVEEVIELAKNAGMKLIALTDHNMFSIKERMQSGDMEVIPGCEFSCTYKVPSRNDGVEIHVIGLFPDGVDPDEFEDIFSCIAEGKKNYVRAVLEKLETLGIHVTMEEVMELKSKAGYVGRHRIAEVIARKGYAETIEEAFDKWLGNLSPHYVCSTKYVKYADMDVVVKKIKEAHGIPILCHVFWYSMSLEEIDKMVSDFAAAAEGAGGLEVYYELYLDNAEKMHFMKELQKKYGLLPSAGSDRHEMDHHFSTAGEMEYFEDMIRAMEECK